MLFSIVYILFIFTEILTFGMIPHIIQKRRAEYYIHHTGCGKRRLLVETEILSAPGCSATSIQSEERWRGGLAQEQGLGERERSAARDMTSGANPN